MPASLYLSPASWVDESQAGQLYQPETVTVPAFFAGSLRHLLLSPEFTRVPKVVKQKLRHCTFFAHLLCKYDLFHSAYAVHRQILDDINCGKTNWKDDEYFKTAEENMIAAMEEQAEKSRGITETNYKHGDPKLANLPEGLPIKMAPESGDDKLPEFESFGGGRTCNSGGDNLAGEGGEDEAESDGDYGGCDEGGDGGDGEVAAEQAENRSPARALVNFSCPYCDTLRSSEKWMMRHLKRQHPHQSLQVSCSCPTCGEVSPDFASHVLHVKSHATFTCHVCSRCFPSRRRLTRHERSHQEAREEVCPYCGKVYKHLRGHIYSVHTEHKLLKCSLCHFHSSLPGAVSHHFRRVHNKPSVCPVCNKTVKDVKRHQRRGGCGGDGEEELERRQFPCESCGKTFTQKYHLHRHVDNIHLKAKDWECQYCSYRTTTNFNLTIHVKRMHEGKQIRTGCHFCGKQVYNLDYHIKAYHQEEILSSAGLEIHTITGGHKQQTETP